MPAHPEFTAAEQANMLAGQAVAYATRYLDGRTDVAQLGRDADRLQLELLTAAYAADANAVLDPTRLLTVVMMRTAATQGAARLDRWQAVMKALVDVVRHESNHMRASGVVRS